MEDFNKKLTKRQYIWSFIDSFLVTFLFLAFVNIAFHVYVMKDYSLINFCLTLILALTLAISFHYRSLLWVYKFIKSKKDMPE